MCPLTAPTVSVNCIFHSYWTDEALPIPPVVASPGGAVASRFDSDSIRTFAGPATVVEIDPVPMRPASTPH